MIYPIRYYGDPVLRRKATPVTRFGPELANLAADMLETMYHANGVGLAAPQIGIPKRLFVALQMGPVDDDDATEATASGHPVDEELTPEEKRRNWGVVAEYVMVNPEITQQEGIQYGQDGCLSVPGIFVEQMPRAERIRIRYYDVHGDEHRLDAEGHFAHVLQHEADHLDGILFFDRLPPSERRIFLEDHRSELAAIQREAKQLLRELKGAPVSVDVR